MRERFLKAIGRRAGHLHALGSVKLWPLVRRLATLLSDYRRSDGRSRYLLNITYEPTYECNQHCRFCFLGRLRNKFQGEELTTREALALVDEGAKLDAGFYITGGEPLLRRDIAEIVSHVKRRALKCGVNTNGLMLERSLARSFARSGLDYLIVSIHGRSEDHDRIVGVEGALEKSIANVEYFMSLSSPTHVFFNFVITPETVFYLKDVLDLAAEIGVGAVTCQHMQFLTRDDLAAHRSVWRRELPQYSPRLVFANPPGNGVAAGEMAKEITDALSYAREVGVKCLVKPPLPPKELKMWYEGPFTMETHCYFPWTDVRVAPNGDVYACQFIPLVAGNVRRSPLKKILNSKSYRDFRRAIARAGGAFPACARCCKLYRDPFSTFANGRRSAGRSSDLDD